MLLSIIYNIYIYYIIIYHIYYISYIYRSIYIPYMIQKISIPMISCFSARSSTICCPRAAFTSTANAACLGRPWRAAKRCRGRSRTWKPWENGDFTKKNIQTWGISEDFLWFMIAKLLDHLMISIYICILIYKWGLWWITHLDDVKKQWIHTRWVQMPWPCWLMIVGGYTIQYYPINIGGYHNPWNWYPVHNQAVWWNDRGLWTLFDWFLIISIHISSIAIEYNDS